MRSISRHGSTPSDSPRRSMSMAASCSHNTSVREPAILPLVESWPPSASSRSAPRGQSTAADRSIGGRSRSAGLPARDLASAARREACRPHHGARSESMKAVTSAFAARSSGSSASRRASAASEVRSCRRSARATSASRMTSDRVLPCSSAVRGPQGLSRRGGPRPGEWAAKAPAFTVARDVLRAKGS